MEMCQVCPDDDSSSDESEELNYMSDNNEESFSIESKVKKDKKMTFADKNKHLTR